MKKLKLQLTHLWYKLLMKLGLKSDEVYYIGGSEALPPPLSKDEEQVLLMKLPNGDQAARAILIERNLRLVVYIARKFENTGINIEDLISIDTHRSNQSCEYIQSRKENQACYLCLPVYRK
nr:hypothetical protein P5642_07410 [Bacillus subtilis]